MKSQAVWLFYETVPNARAHGHPGADGVGGGQPPDARTPEQSAVDEIIRTLTEIRPHLTAKQ